jgi:monothiol glutaredoxin
MMQRLFRGNNPMDAMEFIKKQVEENPVVIFMKGTPDFPQCGFSARASQALAACGEKFATVNIFENPEVHRALPGYSNWPTFPQIFVDGQLVGGCDITLELFQRGELQKMVKAAVEKAKNN